MAEPPRLSGPETGPEDGAAPDSLVVFAHGYGSNGADLMGLVPHLRRVLPRTQFLAPNAPEACPMAPGGYQWFPLSTISREERDSGTGKAAPLLDAYLEAQLERFGLGPERLALVGFSQGTMVSLHAGLRRAPQIAGILGYSGSLAVPERLVDEIRGRPPVLLVHGTADETVPIWLMFESFGALQAAKVPVERHISQNTAHAIAPDGLEAGTRFLQRCLG